MTQETVNFHDLTLLQRCGLGAFGSVYRCQDLSGKQFALKIVPKQQLGTAWQKELKGVQNYRKITEDAPHLLKIFQVGDDDESFFYTMELSDNAVSPESGKIDYQPDTLEKRLENGPMPPLDILNLGEALLDGIRTIHAAGLTHHDIKPANILFVDGQAKIGDVGLMSSVDSMQSHLAGTLDFMPPEVRSGSSPANKESDLYAFGKILYCCLTGFSADRFPAWPPHMPLSWQSKHILLLILKLCDHDHETRLDKIEMISRQLTQTRLRLQQGDGLFGRLRLTQSVLERHLQLTLHHCWHFLRKHTLLSVVLLLSIAGTAYGLIEAMGPQNRPSQELPKTREYANEKFGIAFTIPEEWDIQRAEDIAEQAKDKMEMLKKQFGDDFETFLANVLKSTPDMIICDKDVNQHENDLNCIQIICKNNGRISRNLWNAPEEDLLQWFPIQWKTVDAKPPEVYKVQKMSINSIDCLRFEASFQPGMDKSIQYDFMFDDRYIAVTLTSRISTYDALLPQFEKVVASVREISRTTPTNDTQGN